MTDKTKYILLWYVNWVFLALGLFFFVLFLVKKSGVERYVLIAYIVLFTFFLSLYAVIARICNKALQCEGGYSLTQAIGFYIDCASAGYRGTNAARDVDILQKVAAKRDVLEGLDKAELKKCYHTGEAAVRTCSLPKLKARWVQRSKKHR